MVALVALRGINLLGDDVGLEHHVVAHSQIVDAHAECLHHTEELVAERDGRFLARGGLGVSPRRAEDWAIEGLMKVSVPQMPHQAALISASPGAAVGSGMSSMRMSPRS